MRAIQLNRFGGPDIFDVVEMPKPLPEAGEVLIRVRAAGVNFFEVLMRGDRYAVTPDLPVILGVEAAGTVEALGQGVDISLTETRVAAPLFASKRPFGGYADYVTIDAKLAVPLPDALSFEDATSLMVQGLTAFHLLRQSPPAGKSVLVTAAAGGVGSLLVQLAKRQGASTVIAVAGSRAKLDLALSLGADAAVDYSTSDWPARVRKAAGGAGVDVVYDIVGGPVTAASLQALAPGGELVFAALGRYAIGAAELEAMITRNQSLRGFALLPLLSADGLRAGLSELFHLAASGQLVTQGGRYPLDQAAEAHRSLEERRSTGKVVLIP
ncbi:MAG: zinc-binding alcohol dehydrogenase family protein [Mesorhizobium sp.]|uniref:quinone oxidoreductase family protein n=1 Tax=unclassified Mesorhizobium TaxID=325217 RepID=UPI000FCC3BCC|nr:MULTISPECIES: zinc-binding dehydrogenase [unclassified Mesorhizobium]RUV55549.1 zinc-binding alcohol dehydrogenase family protein [Mesorhizobium sp. M5C.F.Ca.IN.020.29.1.1]RWD49932.1 MAG: zinc-binding alcohol dehydrogenase family protein [Mesorhizobium sp.]RWE52817.1 MAG: zinc-binding alcohol dehydrogenase family protein [Mesorhizobium sp.]RWF07495.1 MAG: zinc-binding alcohol dehydrogenase family protein [Mesorhizobium sp.]RWF21502.1 MAG: zinc-binding alcohol dehydrogenase family protein [M